MVDQRPPPHPNLWWGWGIRGIRVGGSLGEGKLAWRANSPAFPAQALRDTS